MNYGQNKASDAAAQLQTQKLLEQADANANATQRMQQYNQAEQQLVNDVAWMTVFQQANPYVIKPSVPGVIIKTPRISHHRKCGLTSTSPMRLVVLTRPAIKRTHLCGSSQH